MPNLIILATPLQCVQIFEVKVSNFPLYFKKLRNLKELNVGHSMLSYIKTW